VTPAGKSDSGKLRIGAVSNDVLRVEGLRAILEDSCEIVSMTAPDTLRDDDLAMVLVDVAEDDLPALMAALRRARPGLRLIVLGTRNEPAFIQKVVASGAKGYLLHTASPREITMAVEVVADGSIWAPRKVLASLIDTITPSEGRPPEIRLTPREYEVIELLIAGRANREIATTLGVETKTVKSHVGRLLQKFGVPNRVALTVRALEMQIGRDL
jgi:DNA-binding NarL/FixJ family response regulator